MANPFKAVMSVRRQELPFALLMFSYFFLVIASFWVLKPMKKTLFLSYYDQTGFELFSWHMTAAQAELLAKVLNMFVAFLAVTVFTLAVRRLRRQQLTLLFSVFAMACYILFSFVINRPTAMTVWAFYLFGDLFNTLMVATFFAFLNDSVTPDAAKRMYGLVGLGGVAGGVFGTTTLRVWVDRVDAAGWMWICLGAAVLIVIVSQLAGRMVDRDPPPEVESTESGPAESERAATGENPAMEGARPVFRSPYLLAIVGIVGFYEIVSTIMDFQFSATIAHYLDGPDIGRQISLVFTITNWTSMIVQLFLTSYIMTRFGLTVALLVLPVAAFAGSATFMVLPILWVGSLLNTADNGFSYSINQSAKEALYVPTTREEKYKAKAFIDMFVQRFAKAVAVGITLVITSIFTEFSSIRWLSLVTILILFGWITAARYAGRSFREKTES
jgi:AAA family ATP:ADP antiporter